MFWFCVSFVFFVTFVQHASLMSSPSLNETRQEDNEDQRVINETITKYGPPKNYEKLGLPGPEIRDFTDTSLDSKFSTEGSGLYTIKIRAQNSLVSYNARYEESKIVKTEDREFPFVKGQFGEHIVRKGGGFYIRTIGYILDENGYQQFLIDLTSATFDQMPIIGLGISTTVLRTLVGGNAMG